MLDFVQEFLEREGVEKVTIDMCPFGMRSADFDGQWKLVFKPTGRATNFKRIAAAARRRCDNAGNDEWQQHKHVRQHCSDQKYKKLGASLMRQEYAEATLSKLNALSWRPPVYVLTMSALMW